MTPSYHIAVLSGDGIGVEVMKAASHVLTIVGTKIGVEAQDRLSTI